MRKPSGQTIKYLGYGQPITKEEVEFEIISLEQSLSVIKSKICELKRNMYLADLALSKGFQDISQLFGDENENVQNKNRKEEKNRAEDRNCVGYKGQTQEE